MGNPEDRRKRVWMTVAMFFLTTVIVLSVLELAFRESGRLQVEHNERIAVYRYDAELGWFGIPNASAVFSDPITTIDISNNGMGFRDREHGEKTKPRIAVLGDSYIWGFDVQADQRFTDRLQIMLPDWDVVNMGVSGYGNDQEYLAAKRLFPQVSPDLVLLMFCVGNDFVDNASNAVNKGYYKPYFVLQGGELSLRGVPVPKALGYYIREHPIVFESFVVRRIASLYFQFRNPEFKNPYSPTKEIISAIRKLSEARGARFCLALTHYSAEIEKYSEEQGIPYVEVTTDLCYRRLGWHWTPAGNEFVAKKVFTFLRDHGLLSLPHRP